jgi:DNA-binding response OmpR family regulator
MRIAIVDDDETQTELVSQALAAHGHVCHAYAKGSQFLRDLARESFDMLILDWALPDMEGPDLMGRMRETRRMPVLFITSRSSEDDIVAALAAGADDYMIKPLRKNELVARTAALLRRSYPQPKTQDKLFNVEGFCFEVPAGTVQFQGTPVALTQKEFELALLLFRNLGKPLSRAHIMESVWGRDNNIPTRTMDTHVSRVRTRLNLRPEFGFRLSPVYSYGYRLDRINTAE